LAKKYSSAKKYQSRRVFLRDFESLLEERLDYLQFQFIRLLGDMKVVEFPVEIWDSIADGTGVDGSSLGFLPTN